MVFQHANRREMEFSKIQTLRLMLDEERKNLESLSTSSSGNRQKNPEIGRAEANIKKLQEQLKQICGEVNIKSTVLIIFFIH